MYRASSFHAGRGGMSFSCHHISWTMRELWGVWKVRVLWGFGCATMFHEQHSCDKTILLVEETVHHFGCVRQYQKWDQVYILLTRSGCLPSTVLCGELSVVCEEWEGNPTSETTWEHEKINQSQRVLAKDPYFFVRMHSHKMALAMAFGKTDGLLLWHCLQSM